jgi:hypothetical protein
MQRCCPSGTSFTAGYTDIMFGMTSMLRIFFGPRIRSPRESRLYFWDKADAQQFPNVCAYLDGGGARNGQKTEDKGQGNVTELAFLG